MKRAAHTLALAAAISFSFLAWAAAFTFCSVAIFFSFWAFSAALQIYSVYTRIWVYQDESVPTQKHKIRNYLHLFRLLGLLCCLLLRLLILLLVLLSAEMWKYVFNDESERYEHNHNSRLLCETKNMSWKQPIPTEPRNWASLQTHRPECECSNRNIKATAIIGPHRYEKAPAVFWFVQPLSLEHHRRPAVLIKSSPFIQQFL